MCVVSAFARTRVSVVMQPCGCPILHSVLGATTGVSASAAAEQQLKLAATGRKPNSGSLLNTAWGKAAPVAEAELAKVQGKPRDGVTRYVLLQLNSLVEFFCHFADPVPLGTLIQVCWAALYCAPRNLVATKLQGLACTKNRLRAAMRPRSRRVVPGAYSLPL